jgi:hypothetical protein
MAEPGPIPVPPVDDSEQFTISIDSHVPFAPAPTPDDLEPPVTINEPLKSDVNVRFDHKEHSIPARLSDDEQTTFVPSDINVTELEKSEIDAVLLKEVLSKTIVSSVVVIDRLLSDDDPVIITGES